MQKINILLLICILLTGCKHKQTTESLPTFPAQPSRTAYEGFEWELVSGTNLKFWAQHNETIHVIANDSIPGAQIEWNDSQRVYRTVIQIFPLENRQIEDLFDILKVMPDWDPATTCAFREIKCTREGVKRYVLEPTGAAAEDFKKRTHEEPIPTTCSGWGVGNSGIRYFEIHQNKPDKVLFIEIGQEAPLFDEQSIVLVEK